MKLAGPLEVQGVGSQIYLSDPAFRARLERPPEEDPAAAAALYRRLRSQPALSWDAIGRLRELTSLPVLVKGIQHPDDAREAIERGAAAIVCSNHGGRQVDGAIASLDALPAIVAAAAGRVPVLFDSGVRSGSDVLKALALGAEAVLVGRPTPYVASGSRVKPVSPRPAMSARRPRTDDRRCVARRRSRNCAKECRLCW